jgi:uncharacterized delta-60 repeat protein
MRCRRDLLLTVVAMTGLAGPARATEWNLDPTFGTHGLTAFDATPTEDFANDLALQGDGGIVVVGSSSILETGRWIVARFTATGSPDDSFGSGGLVTTDVGGGTATAVAIQGDGKIVVAGNGNGGTDSLAARFTVARYEPDGTPDMGFGAGGLVETDTGSLYEIASGVALEEDGKIVVAGHSYDVLGKPSRLTVVRYNGDGTLDPSFGPGGVVVTAMADGSVTPNDVAIQPDGGILVAGRSFAANHPGIVARYLPSGVLDSSFGVMGVAVLGPYAPGSTLPNAIALTGEGTIVLGGGIGARVAAFRLLANGSLDDTFGGGDGVADVDFFPESPFMGGMVLEPDGATVLVGSVHGLYGPARVDTLLVRFDPDGALDTSYGNGGHAHIVVGARNSQTTAAVRRSDGKIVAAGRVTAGPVDGTEGALAVTRFGGTCGDGTLDATEQCDDGNSGGFDCCSAGCRLDPPGQLCAADASDCSYDTCDGAGGCASGGPWPPADCLAVTAPGKAQLRIVNRSGGERDRLLFKWTRGDAVPGAGFGYPNGFTGYTMCLFDESGPVSTHVIPSGPEWLEKRSSWKLRRDPHVTPGGIGSATLRASSFPGKTSALVAGEGQLLGPPALPLAGTVTAQLVSSDGLCLQATYAAPIANTSEKYAAKGQ